ncbi:hypothetical protein SDC9_101285 [bioreactor metagenome]|uniref:Uncharacterized protein n=1 Tax=bioreactor metagenome TaxID=1076179 RepID=A0A645AN86_9ZZZZ
MHACKHECTILCRGRIILEQVVLGLQHHAYAHVDIGSGQGDAAPDSRLDALQDNSVYHCRVSICCIDQLTPVRYEAVHLDLDGILPGIQAAYVVGPILECRCSGDLARISHQGRTDRNTGIAWRTFQDNTSCNCAG